MPYASLPARPEMGRNSGDVSAYYQTSLLLAHRRSQHSRRRRHRTRPGALVPVMPDALADPASATATAVDPTTAEPSSRACCRALAPLDLSKPTVLLVQMELLSATATSALSLLPSALADDFNFLSIELRGHGRTVCVPKAGFDVDDAQADILDALAVVVKASCDDHHDRNATVESTDEVKQLLARLEGKVHLLAVSVGCLVGMRIAADHPELVASLTIAGPVTEEETPENMQGFLEVAHQIRSRAPSDDKPVPPTEKVQELLRALVQRCFGSSYRISPKAWRRLKTENVDRLMGSVDGDAEANFDMLCNMYCKRAKMDADRLARIRCEVQIVEGTSELPYERPIAESFRPLFPNAAAFKIYRIRGAPHLVNVTHPAELGEILVPFVHRLAGLLPSDKMSALSLQDSFAVRRERAVSEVTATATAAAATTAAGAASTSDDNAATTLDSLSRVGSASERAKHADQKLYQQIVSGSGRVGAGMPTTPLPTVRSFRGDAGEGAEEEDGEEEDDDEDSEEDDSFSDERDEKADDGGASKGQQHLDRRAYEQRERDSYGRCISALDMRARRALPDSVLMERERLLKTPLPDFAVVVEEVHDGQ